MIKLKIQINLNNIESSKSQKKNVIVNIWAKTMSQHSQKFIKILEMKRYIMKYKSSQQMEEKEFILCS